MTKYDIEAKTVEMLKTVFDPEIPVNVWDLGMIYSIDVAETAEPTDGKHFDISIDMTFTAPSCPAADFILEDVRQKVENLTGLASAKVNLVFEPEWDKSMMTEEARVELGFE